VVWAIALKSPMPERSLDRTPLVAYHVRPSPERRGSDSLFDVDCLAALCGALVARSFVVGVGGQREMASTRRS